MKSSASEDKLDLLAKMSEKLEALRRRVDGVRERLAAGSVRDATIVLQKVQSDLEELTGSMMERIREVGEMEALRGKKEESGKEKRKAVWSSRSKRSIQRRRRRKRRSKWKEEEEHEEEQVEHLEEEEGAGGARSPVVAAKRPRPSKKNSDGKSKGKSRATADGSQQQVGSSEKRLDGCVVRMKEAGGPLVYFSKTNEKKGSLWMCPAFGKADTRSVDKKNVSVVKWTELETNQQLQEWYLGELEKDILKRFCGQSCDGARQRRSVRPVGSLCAVAGKRS